MERVKSLIDFNILDKMSKIESCTDVTYEGITISRRICAGGDRVFISIHYPDKKIPLSECSTLIEYALLLGSCGQIELRDENSNCKVMLEIRGLVSQRKYERLLRERDRTIEKLLGPYLNQETLKKIIEKTE
jgi:hypothetical protein